MKITHVRVKSKDELIEEYGQKENGDIKSNPLIEVEYQDAVCGQDVPLVKEHELIDGKPDGILQEHELAKVASEHNTYIHLDCIDGFVCEDGSFTPKKD